MCDYPLEAKLERFLGAEPSGSAAALAELTAGLKQATAQGQFDQAAKVLRRAIVPGLDYTSLQGLHRIYRRLKHAQGLSGRAMRLAVLGGFTTHQLCAFLELHLFAGGVAAEIYESEYSVFRQEVLDAASGVYAGRPEFVFLAPTWRDLGLRGGLGQNPGQVGELVAQEVARWSSLWGLLHERLGCQVIQNDFEQPPARPLGNLEMRHPSSRGRLIAMVNQAMRDQAPAYVTIHDVDHLAALAGRWTWSDERFYHEAKLPCAPECLGEYAHSVASILLCSLGAARKCLVLDLDNTLWGGVVGDDGLGGLRLGQGDPQGEAFLAFQRYLKDLKDRGVLLAVCSKNEDATAREVFVRHPEMVLRLDDIACFVANWTDKAANLRHIAATLNIGLDSLVFVDDNPAERAIVRRFLPEVAVPELPADPAGYVQAIERHRYFQAVSLGAEDLARTEYYQANARRQAAVTEASNVEEFLQSLEMKAQVGPVTDLTLERSVQLIAKSNQFNLTTRRLSAAEVLQRMQDPAWITRTVSLRDRFGDNGLISVLMAEADGEALRIDLWLMSCRVLRRGVEQFLLNHLAALARRRGLRKLRGEYRPTPKNALVRDHYAGLGFAPVADGQGARGAEGGATLWELGLGESWRPLPHFIEENPSNATGS